MSRIKLTVIALVIFISKITNAQSDFQYGYIITSRFDTLYGKIDNRNYNDNAQYCDFLNSGSVVRYYPDQIFGYRFTKGKYYISKEIGNKKVFMEFLIDGKLDIYFSQDKEGINHYYASKDTLPLQELKYEKDILVIDGEYKSYESKKYIGLLSYYTHDCPSLAKEIPDLNELNHKNLIRFAKNYHDLTCPDETCLIYEKKLPFRIKLGVYGGTNIIFKNITELEKGVYASYGFNILFQQAEINERIYIGLGLYRDGQMGYGMSYCRIPFSINYLNPRPGFSPVISYQFDLNRGLFTEAIEIGMKYQLKKISLVLLTDNKTRIVIEPYSSSINFGLMYDLR